MQLDVPLVLPWNLLIPLNIRNMTCVGVFVHMFNLPHSCHHLTEAHDDQANREVVTKTLLLSCDVVSNFQLLG